MSPKFRIEDKHCWPLSPIFASMPATLKVNVSSNGAVAHKRPDVLCVPNIEATVGDFGQKRASTRYLISSYSTPFQTYSIKITGKIRKSNRYYRYWPRMPLLRKDDCLAPSLRTSAFSSLAMNTRSVASVGFSPAAGESSEDPS